jgi:tetratricopeptide (TPR) repeat protein
MTRSSLKVLVAIILAGSLSSFAAAQAPASSQTPTKKRPPAVQQPQEEEPYTVEEYDDYEKAKDEKDGDKKIAALLAFMEKYPKSKLQPYITNEYKTLVYEYQKTQNYAKLKPAAEKWLKYEPNDLPTIAYITEASQKLGDDKTFLEYGQKVYAAKPSGSLAYFMAQTYKKMGDEVKYKEWVQKTLSYPEFSSRFDLWMEYVDKYAKEKNLVKATEYGDLTLKALESAKKPDATSEADWRKAVRDTKRGCHYIKGLHLYEKEKYADSIKELEQALSVDPRFDMAYYYIGLSQWKLGKVENEEAPLTFAKAYLLKGEIAEQAKDHLEKIYKALHNNTLVNVQKVYDRAKEELAKVK